MPLLVARNATQIVHVEEKSSHPCNAVRNHPFAFRSEYNEHLGNAEQIRAGYQSSCVFFSSPPSLVPTSGSLCSLHGRSLGLSVELFGRWLFSSAIIFAGALGLLVPITVLVVTVVTTIPVSATTATATTAITEAVLTVIRLAGLPVVGVRVAVIGVEATTAATTAASTTLEFGAFARLQLALSNELVLLLNIGLLRHDLQLVALPLGSGIEGKEGLGLFLGLELGKDRALEKVVGRATQADSIDSIELGKERLNVKLCRRLFIAETLNVDRAFHVITLLGRVVRMFAGNGLLSLLAINYEKVAFLQGLHDCLVGLETSHALKGTDRLEVHRVVAGTIDKVP